MSFSNNLSLNNNKNSIDFTQSNPLQSNSSESNSLQYNLNINQTKQEIQNAIEKLIDTKLEQKLIDSNISSPINSSPVNSSPNNGLQKPVRVEIMIRDENNFEYILYDSNNITNSQDKYIATGQTDFKNRYMKIPNLIGKFCKGGETDIGTEYEDSVKTLDNYTPSKYSLPNVLSLDIVLDNARENISSINF